MKMQIYVMIQLVAKHGLIKKLDFLGGEESKEKVTGIQKCIQETLGTNCNLSNSTNKCIFPCNSGGKTDCQ